MRGLAISTCWTRRCARALAPRSGQAGLTLIELIVAFSLMLILSSMALPLARVKVQREKERRLRMALEEIRTAIDRYKDMADQGLLAEQDPDNHGYPEDLESLVEGVPLEQDSLAGPGAGGLGSANIGGIAQSSSLGTRPLSGLRGRSGTGNLSTQRPGMRGGREGGIGGSSRSSLGQPRGFGSRDESGDPSGVFADDALGLGEERDAPEQIRFLRSIPVDPMTGRREWGLQSVSSSPMARSWTGRNVFDVYSLSAGIALDGSSFSEW